MIKKKEKIVIGIVVIIGLYIIISKGLLVELIVIGLIAYVAYNFLK